MTQSNVYLDYNATSPLHPGLYEEIPKWLKQWGNASSIHYHGRQTRKILREARDAFADLVGANSGEIIFTSCGSESNNMVLKNAMHLPEAIERKEIISSKAEHPSVLRTLEYLATQGFAVKYVDLKRTGELCLDSYKQLLSSKTLLVTIMAANNETGVINPILEMAELSKECGAYFHTDAVQALGRMPFRLDHGLFDFVSFSGHKFYAMKGAGVLYSRKGKPLQSLIHGGGQEKGRRAGTENVLAISSMGYMAKHLKESEAKWHQMSQLRDHMQEVILKELPGVEVIARSAHRLPNTCSLIIEGVYGESLLMSLDMKGYSLSSGSACSSGSSEPSHVLKAIGLDHNECQSSLRISLGWTSTESDVLGFAKTLVEVVRHMRKLRAESETSGARS